METLGELRQHQRNIVNKFHENWALRSHAAPKHCKNIEGNVHVLMLKVHKETGLKYLCKKSFKKGSKSINDCLLYKGSGKRWKNHLNKHGDDIETHIIYCTDDEHNFRNAAFNLSLGWDIVNRQDFANLTEEKGDGGLIGSGQLGKTWKIKDTSKMGGPRVCKEGSYLSRSAGNNYQCSYYIFTPWGRYETWKDAICEAKKLKALGVNNVIIDQSTLKLYCVGTLLSPTGRRTPVAWRGKHTLELGFGLEKKCSEKTM